MLAVGAPAVGEIFVAGRFRHLELLEQHRGVGEFEIVPGVFLLGLQEDVAIGDLLVVAAAVEVEIVDALDALHVHRQPLEPVSELARDRRAFEAGDLLEIGELRDLHAVAPAFPAEPPGAERRALPVVLDKADVVDRRVDADDLQRIEVEILDVGRRRLQDHLELVVVLQPVGVLAVAAVFGPARGLHIGGVPGLGPERAQRGGRMEGARPHFHVVGLQNDAPPVRPIALQGQDQPLEGARRVEIVLTRAVPGRRFSHRFEH